MCVLRACSQHSIRPSIQCISKTLQTNWIHPLSITQWLQTHSMHTLNFASSITIQNLHIWYTLKLSCIWKTLQTHPMHTLNLPSLHAVVSRRSSLAIFLFATPYLLSICITFIFDTPLTTAAYERPYKHILHTYSAHTLKSTQLTCGCIEWDYWGNLPARGPCAGM